MAHDLMRCRPLHELSETTAATAAQHERDGQHQLAKTARRVGGWVRLHEKRLQFGRGSQRCEKRVGGELTAQYTPERSDRFQRIEKFLGERAQRLSDRPYGPEFALDVQTDDVHLDQATPFEVISNREAGDHRWRAAGDDG